MTETEARGGGRGRLTWAAIVGLPLLANALLAVYLATRIPAVVPEVVAIPDKLLPGTSRDEIVGVVELKTNSDYACDGSWRLAPGISASSCRTDSALAVVQSVDGEGAFRIEVTWFGFDESDTELPAWTAAALGASPEADAAAEWVADHVGTDAQMEIEGIKFVVNGAEGARTLIIEASPSPALPRAL